MSRGRRPNEIAALGRLATKGSGRSVAASSSSRTSTSSLFAGRGRRPEARHQARPDPLLRADRAGDAAASRGPATQPAPLSRTARSARASGRRDIPTSRRRRGCASGTKRASATSARRTTTSSPTSVGDALLARQPGGVRDPRLDLEIARALAADLRADRHRPGPEDDLGRGRDAREAVPDGPRSPRRCGRIPRSPAGAASRRGSRSCRSTTTATPATGSKASRGRSAAIVPDLVSWEWSVANRKGLARLDYTQNASIKTLVAPYARPSGRRRPGERPDRLGRARRPRPAARPLDHPHDRRRASPSGATCSPAP